MTDDLNTLRPEVREAFLYFDRFENHPSGWATIRAELLRLTARNAELEAKATRDHDWVSDLLSENKKAEAELAEMKQSFDLRWKADMRAIEQWRAAHPGKELTWPDHAGLCVWLMDELAALKARIADSPIASLVYGQGDLLAVISAENPDDWAGKRVRLVVENRRWEQIANIGIYRTDRLFSR